MQRLEGAVTYLIGDRDDFHLVKRLFNTTALLTIGMLVVLALVNYVLGFRIVSFTWAVALLVVSGVFILVRFYNRYALAYTIYALTGYTAMFINFAYNSGTAGPTLTIFLFFFVLLVMMSPIRISVIWVFTHSFAFAAMILGEYYYPEVVHYTYENEAHRLSDNLISHVAVVFVLFVAIIFIRKNFKIEHRYAKRLAEENVKKNHRLQELNHQKDRLPSILSHDLRGPLTSIKGFYNVLNLDTERLSKDEEQHIQRRLASMVGGTLDMLENILFWSRCQSEASEFALDVVDINECIDDLLPLYKEMADEKSIDLVVADRGVNYCMAQVEVLAIVLRNLIANAIKFTENGGKVIVSTYRSDGRAVIEVSDSGIGMDERTVSELFKINPKLSYGTNREKGTGMGLVVCKDLIDRMNGDIEVESAVKKGSSFKICLDLALEELAQLN